MAAIGEREGKREETGREDRRSGRGRRERRGMRAECVRVSTMSRAESQGQTWGGYTGLSTHLQSEAGCQERL